MARVGDDVPFVDKGTCMWTDAFGIGPMADFGIDSAASESSIFALHGSVFILQSYLTQTCFTASYTMHMEPSCLLLAGAT